MITRVFFYNRFFISLGITLFTQIVKVIEKVFLKLSRSLVEITSSPLNLAKSAGDPVH